MFIYLNVNQKHISQVRNYVIKWAHTNRSQSLPYVSLLQAIMDVKNKLAPSSFTKSLF